MARGRPFSKGQSGNPGGRPAGRTAAVVLRERLAGRTDLDGTPLDGGRTLLDKLVDRMIEGALGGDSRIQKLLIERLDGRAAANVEERAEIELLKANIAELRELVERGTHGGAETDPGGAGAPPGAGRGDA
jgi:hypothetical protein